MKDLGIVKKDPCHGNSQTHKSRKVVVSQRKYMKRVLERFRMTNAKPISTPFARALSYPQNYVLVQSKKKLTCLMGTCLGVPHGIKGITCWGF